MTDIIETGAAVINRQCNGTPVLFLDCDGVLAPGNGGDIDRETVEMVATFIRLADACVVLCSDRVRFRGFYGDLVSAGFPTHRLRGQCDPSAPASATGSSKVNRVISWLTIADEQGVSPSRWCIVDDCWSFSRHWSTQSVHVRPAGPLLSRVEMGLVWTYLTGKLPHSLRREALAE